MQKKRVKGRNIDDGHEIWSAIRYLDPDKKQEEGNGAAIISILALALAICIVWVWLHLRGL
jgi:hypothetical protein